MIKTIQTKLNLDTYNSINIVDKVIPNHSTDRWTIGMDDWRDRDTDSEIETGNTFQSRLQTGMENCRYD